MKTTARSFILGLFFAALLNCRGQTSVHRFGRITALLDQTVSLELLGTAPTAFKPYYDIYSLEVSRDLIDWKALPTLLRTNDSTNALYYGDSTATATSRFYRTFTNHLATPFPKPSGPYAVGTLSRLLTDPSRTNRYGIPT